MSAKNGFGADTITVPVDGSTPPGCPNVSVTGSARDETTFVDAWVVFRDSSGNATQSNPTSTVQPNGPSGTRTWGLSLSAPNANYRYILVVRFQHTISSGLGTTFLDRIFKCGTPP